MLPVLATSRTVLRPAIGALAKTSARANSYARHVSGPPRVRISFPEKVAHGIVLFVGCSIIPWVITYNMPNYKGSEDEEE